MDRNDRESHGSPTPTDLRGASEPLFSRAEFDRRRVLLGRFARACFVIWLIGVLFGFLAILQVIVTRPPLFLLVLPAVAFVEVLVLASVVQIGRWWLGLTCPDCRAAMVSYDQPDGRVTVAADRCRGCGRVLIDDAMSARTARALPPTTPAVFVECRDRLEGATRRDYAAAGLVAIAAIAGGVIGARTLLRSGASLFFVAGAPLLPLIIALLVLFVLEGRWEARARALGLACAKCGELLVGGPQNTVTRAVLARGMCPRCNAVLWSHPGGAATDDAHPPV